MAIPVKLEAFEGPLDLLLHLIEVNKIDIYDIPIVLITEQYLEYVRALETEDMNIMSEFLVMAATLLNIKCKMLLPKEVNEEGEEEDPRAELVERLLEYKKYKYMSYELKDLLMDAGHSLYKKRSIPAEINDYEPPVNYEELLGDVTLNKLHEIFNFMLKRQEERVDPIRNSFGKIAKDEINIEEKQRYIENYILLKKHFSFRELLEKQNSKMEIIVSFLAVLEMIKYGIIEATQGEDDEDIVIDVKQDSDEIIASLKLIAEENA